VGKVGGAMDITIKVNDKMVGQGQVPTAISLHFTTNESLDIGSDTSSPVSLDYYDQAPFAFNGRIGTTKIAYPKK
jgi:arylsulfatase